MAIREECGTWLDESALDSANAPTCLVCPVCGHCERLVRYPLWWIAGSSGSGAADAPPATRLARVSSSRARRSTSGGMATPTKATPRSTTRLLKVAHQIALGNRPVVFVATAYPQQLATCPHHHYFAPLHFLGLVCSEQAQRERLRSAPPGATPATPEFITQSCAFSRGLETLARQDPTTLTLHDTTEPTPTESAATIAAWVRQTLPTQNAQTLAQSSTRLLRARAGGLSRCAAAYPQPKPSGFWASPSCQTMPRSAHHPAPLTPQYLRW
ncbi:MAG: hypothetical protein U0841_10780 [Chloroflexia bacterium]